VQMHLYTLLPLIELASFSTTNSFPNACPTKFRHLIHQRWKKNLFSQNLFLGLWKQMKMATKEKSKSKQIGSEIKLILSRNQRWLSDKICMREPLLSEKINGRKDFTQDELDAINKVLSTSFKL